MMNLVEIDEIRGQLARGCNTRGERGQYQMQDSRQLAELVIRLIDALTEAERREAA